MCSYYFVEALCVMCSIRFDQGSSYLNRSHTGRQYKPSIIAMNHHHYTYCSCGKTPGILMHISFLLRMEFKRITRATLPLSDKQTSHASFQRTPNGKKPVRFKRDR